MRLRGMTLRPFMAFVAALVLLASSGSVSAQAGSAPKPPVAASNTTQALMRQKLENAHGLLEGIIREDYALIIKYGEALANISRATTWHKLDSEDFMVHARNFQASTDYLLEQARAKNIEGVALGYVRVTLDCMRCHDGVRAGRSKLP